jgi:flagellar hook-basal body complex protein FliE
MDISGIRPPLTPTGLSSLKPVEKPVSTQPGQAAESQPTFGKLLDGLSQTQNESDQLMQKLAAGEEVDLHSVMISSEQTDISFRVALAIRDKLVDAYRDTMHMSV